MLSHLKKTFGIHVWDDLGTTGWSHSMKIVFLHCLPSLPQVSDGQSVDCQTPAPLVESVTQENVKFSGHWPQQQWSSVYRQSRAPTVGVAQSGLPMEGGRKGHSGQIGNEIKDDQS